MKSRVLVHILRSTLIAYTLSSGSAFAIVQEQEKCKCDLEFNSSMQEIAGPKYRKISLNGMPMADEKPQANEEKDEPKEQTYIDALNHTLQHSITDVYIPLGGTDLSLTVRRNTTSEIWNDVTGPTPYIAVPLGRPDRPFGYGWTSNLAANIEIIYHKQTYTPPDTSSPCPQGGLKPDEAVVTDESGVQCRFLILYINGSLNYLPEPNGHQEVEPYVNSLDYEDGLFVYRKKYGTTLRFKITNIIRDYINRYTPHGKLGDSIFDEERTFARLVSITDRFSLPGTAPTVVYNGTDDSLIPTSIVARGKTIQVTSDSERVTSITDPNGHTWTYAYDALPNFSNPKSVLKSVTSPTGAVTQYQYNVGIDQDYAPSTSVEPWHIINKYYYLDLTQITDPRGKVWSFYYAFDHSKLNSHLGEGATSGGLLVDGYYIANDNPRNVYQVTTPVGSAYFFNKSQIKVTWGINPDSNGDIFDVPPDTEIVRYMEVTDAEGQKRSYYFQDSNVVLDRGIGDYLYVELPKRQYPWKIYYKTMELYDADGVKETFTFDPDSAMALTSATDWSGNTTSFTHTDPVDTQNRYPFLPTVFAAGNFADPNSQTNALGKTKTFQYNSKRLMSEIVDELGRKTDYDFDASGNRTRERIYDPSGNLVKDTEFKYEDANFPGFMTKKIVHSLDSDRTWMKDMVTQYVAEPVTGNLQKEIADPSGLALTTQYTYDANNNRTTVKNPRGFTTTYEYYADNRLEQIDYPDSTYKKFTYDLAGNKTDEEDENHHIVHYDYDDANRLIQTTYQMGGTVPDIVTKIGYNKVNSKTSETDGRGHVTQYDYDALQRLTKVTDAKGNITQYAYDPTLNSGGSAFDTSSYKPTKITDARSFVKDITYDKLYREINTSVQYTTAGDRAVTQKQYDDVGNLTQVTDPLNKVTKTDYDALNRPTKVTYADGKFVQNWYTSTGLKWKTRDEFNDPNRETETEYDLAGRAITVTGPAVADYDSGGAMVRPITRTSYDEDGNIASTTNPRNQVWNYTYDNRDRKIKEEQPAVNGVRPTINSHYDNVGNLASLDDARGYTTTYTYDAKNRQTKIELPNINGLGRPTTQKKYDACDNVVEVTDPNGHVTDNAYDEVNRLHTTTDAAGITVTYEYDGVGNRTAVVDGKNQRTEFAYDGLNRNTSITDAAGYATTFGYDAVNKTSRTDALQQVTNYTYDDRHRLQTVNYVGPRSQDSRVYNYDAVGNLLSVTESGTPMANVAYTYDGLNRQTTETSNGYTHTYQYDLAGNRRYCLYGGTTNALVSTYDALNRLSNLTESGRQTSYTYDGNGNVLTKTLPNGDVITSTYDEANRCSTLSATGVAGAIYGYTYVYDLAGNLKSDTETYGNTSLNRVVTMDYDAIDRLLTETVTGNGAGVTSYTYDNANNRATRTKNGILTTYNYSNLNQVTSFTEGDWRVTYAYNNNGNCIEKDDLGHGGDPAIYGFGTNFLYDYEGRLVIAHKYHMQNDHAIWNFAYDYRGRRLKIARTGNFDFETQQPVSQGTTLISFSGGTSVREFENNIPSVDYIRGSDWGGGVGGILYTLRSGVPSFTHYNRRGDVTAKTNGGGTVTYQATYEAYGKRVTETGSTQDRQKSNTKDEDMLGYANEGFRFRDLETGTFITRDPAGFVDGPNLYAYVKQNPWTKFDPEGLNATWGGNNWFANWILPDPVSHWQAGSAGAEQMVSGNSVGDRITGGLSWAGNGAMVLLSMIPGEGTVERLAEGAGVKLIQNVSEKAADSVLTKSARDIVHGNSRESTKLQHTYDIVEKDTGELHKTGISGQELNKNGSSPRANRQVNKLNKEAGFEKYEAKVTGTKIPGRETALEKEQARVDEHAAANGGVGPPGNIRPSASAGTAVPASSASTSAEVPSKN